MAHFTKEFRTRVILPLGIIILLLFCSIVILSIIINWAIIILIIPVIIIIFILIKQYTINKYKNIKLNIGTFEYSSGKLPSAWHKKMGYLRFLEIITPQEYKIDLYRECGANIGDNVVLAGKILEPDMTTIGENTVIGVDALITAHEIILQGGRIVIRIYPVAIGENCVIGTKSVILPGVNILGGTMIPASSVVRKSNSSCSSNEKGDK